MMDKLPTEIKILDVWRSNRPLVVVYKLEKFVRSDGAFIVAYTSFEWKECLELVKSKNGFNEVEMLNRLNNNFYFGKKLKEIIV